MNINRNKPDLWKSDVEKSVDFYNRWFLSFAPATYRQARASTAKRVRKAFKITSDSRDLSPATMDESPKMLEILRQMTCPPLARDRLAGLAGVSKAVVKHFEDGLKESKRCKWGPLLAVIRKLIDTDLMPWLDERVMPKPSVRRRAVMVVADRLCGALSDPIIRNAQEARQLASIAAYLEQRGYRRASALTYREMQPGEFAYHLNIPVHHGDRNGRMVNIPVDVAILPKSARQGDLPIMIEAKSAGDFANVNKRRKEEAQKMSQLKGTYGDVTFILFLCGYFDGGYLGYEAQERIDWIWEHRISDMEKLGL